MRDLIIRYGVYADATSVLSDISSWSTLLYGSFLYKQGEITATDLSQFIFFAAYMVSNLANISYVWSGLMKAAGSGERVFRLLDHEPSIYSSDLHEQQEHDLHIEEDAGSKQQQRRQADALQEEAFHEQQQQKIQKLTPHYAEVTINHTRIHTLLPPLAFPYFHPPHPFSGHIAFDHVTFAYPSAPDRLVLDDVSFTISPGQVVALVGPSGSGKSSMVHLLSRYYDVTAGSVCLDGIDIRLLHPAWYHRSIGMVSQEPTVFARTITENIAYALPESQYNEVKIHRAAQQAHADDFISQINEGYNAVLGERGVSLSGGQKQRLCIARSLLRQPACLVFDESTSALDAKSEAEVQRAIDTICSEKNKSVIVIAHRLSTIRNADVIMVIQQGKIIESGKHEQLVAEKGLYWSLIQAQLENDTEAEADIQSTAELSGQARRDGTNGNNHRRKDREERKDVDDE